MRDGSGAAPVSHWNTVLLPDPENPTRPIFTTASSSVRGDMSRAFLYARHGCRQEGRYHHRFTSHCTTLRRGVISTPTAACPQMLSRCDRGLDGIVIMARRPPTPRKRRTREHVIADLSINHV